MHDTLGYMQENPIHRSYHHNVLTFSMLYAFSENFVLPLSHDEVVHGKGMLLAKMPGDTWQKMANLRLLYAYMWAHPGKKLLFMGSEFGQWNEWNQDKKLDWILLDFASHRGIRSLVQDLNLFLRANSAMFEHDHDWNGFEWMDFSDYKSSVYSFVRKAEGAPPVLWVFNFTPVVRENYLVPCPSGGMWREVLNSDSMIYGGSNVGNYGEREAVHQDHRHCLNLTLPPLGALAFMPVS
jgi:1,4-alpha-glucan branching enzyme